MSKNIRRVIAILLCVTSIILIFLPAKDMQASTEKGDFVFDGGTLVSYKGSDSEIALPDFVTSVGKDAFSGNENLTKVVIPNSVVSIDSDAFNDCKNLRSVRMGDSVKSIGQSAFSGCSNLASVNIPAKCKSIGSGAFARCNSLSDVSISSDNKEFICYDGVIYSKDGRRLVQYLAGRPDSVYVMPMTVDTIEEYAFWGADKLANVSVSASVERIPDHAFDNCTALESVGLPSSVTSLMSYSFADCTNLKNMYIPDTVGFIHETAFYRSDGVKTEFSTGQTYGNGGSYGNNVNAGAVTRSDGGNSDIGALETTDMAASNNQDLEVAFDGTESDQNPSYNAYNEIDINTNQPIASLTPADNARQFIDDSSVNDSNSLAETYLVGGNGVAFVPTNVAVKGFDIEEAEAEDQEIYNSGSSVTVPQYNDRITTREFYRNSSIKNISLTDELKEIGDFAFARSSLESVSIPKGTDKIGYAAFYHCENLEDVDIPDSVETIELGAFEGTKWLNDWRNTPDLDNYLIVGDGILLAYKGDGGSISIPEGVKQIAAGCFEGDKRITGVKFPETLEKIGEDAFNGCLYLTDMVLPQSVKKIEDRAFKSSGINKVMIPASVEEIGLGAFDNTDNNNVIKLAIFLGNDLPDVTNKPTAGRVSAANLLTPAFNGTENAFITQKADIDSGTIFDPLHYGFRGQVYCVLSNKTDENTGTLKLIRSTKIPNDEGVVEIDPHVNYSGSEFVMSEIEDSAFDAYKYCYDFSGKQFTDIKIGGNTSASVEKLIKKIGRDKSRDTGEMLNSKNAVEVSLNMEDLPEGAGEKVKAVVPKNDRRYYLTVSDNPSLYDKFDEAFRQCYGDGIGDFPMLPVDITMTDKSGSVGITKFGRDGLEITLPIPNGMAEEKNLKIATLNENGELETFAGNVWDNGGVKCIDFKTSHLSPFVVYSLSDSRMVASKRSGNDGLMNADSIDEEDTDSNKRGRISLGEDMEMSIPSDDSMSSNGVYGVIQSLNKRALGTIEIKWFVIVIMLSLAAILFLSKKSNKK